MAHNSEWRLSKNGKYSPVLALFLILSVTAIPFVYIRLVTGAFIPDVLPSLQPDSDYYLAQIRDVLDGNLWLGNPYIAEYAHLRSPSVIVAVWMAAVPGLFGLTIPQIAAFNIIFYSLATGMLLFAFLLRITEGKPWLSAIMTGVGVAYVHNWLVRPVVMQTVYPFLLLFLLALYGYVHKRTAATAAVLGLVAAASFYVYLFLWMVVFTSIGLLTLWLLWKRQWSDIKRLCWMWAGILVLIAPEAWHTYMRMSDPLFVEAAERLGIVRSHLINPVTAGNIKYLLLIVIGLIAVHRLRRMPWKSGSITLALAVGAVIITALSNVITGTDMNLITHPWRLGLPLTIAGCAWFLANGGKQPSARIVSGGCAIVLLATFAMHTVIRANAFTYLWEADMHQSMQEFAVPFQILEELPPGVVLADEHFSCLVPVYTPHTVVFCGSAYYHAIPTPELLERALLQRLPRANESVVRAMAASVTGIGPERRSTAANRRNAFCRTTRLCADDGQTYTAFALAGGQPFIDDGMRMLRDLQENTEDAFRRFGVTYIVVDRSSDEHPPIPAQAQTLYEDDRWRILRR